MSIHVLTEWCHYRRTLWQIVVYDVHLKKSLRTTLIKLSRSTHLLSDIIIDTLRDTNCPITKRYTWCNLLLTILSQLSRTTYTHTYTHNDSYYYRNLGVQIVTHRIHNETNQYMQLCDTNWQSLSILFCRVVTSSTLKSQCNLMILALFPLSLYMSPGTRVGGPSGLVQTPSTVVFSWRDSCPVTLTWTCLLILVDKGPVNEVRSIINFPKCTNLRELGVFSVNSSNVFISLTPYVV